MREDDLRRLLGAYAEDAGELPTVSAIRARGARRRARASRLALAGVATLAAGTLVVTQLPRPSVPATPLAPTPTSSATPATPTPTPVRTSTLPTATASASAAECKAVTDAWRKAVSSTTKMPKVLGTKPKREGLIGHAEFASGIVRGKRVYRVFPDGLGGDSYVVPDTDGLTVHFLAYENGRLVYRVYDDFPRSWRVLVQDTPDGAARALMERTSTSAYAFLFTLRGGVFRWLEVGPSSAGEPVPVAFKEIDLNGAGAEVRIAHDFGTVRWGGGTWSSAGYLLKLGKVWHAFALDDLSPRPVPAGVGAAVKGAGLSGELDRSLVLTGEEQLWLVDRLQGTVTKVMPRHVDSASVSGHLVLAYTATKVFVIDLNTGASISVVRSGAGYITLSGDGLYRGPSEDGSDPGTRVDLSTLPTTIPHC